MKTRQAKKILKNFAGGRRNHVSRYWYYRVTNYVTLYCARGEGRRDHRIAEAIRLQRRLWRLGTTWRCQHPGKRMQAAAGLSWLCRKFYESAVSQHF